MLDDYIFVKTIVPIELCKKIEEKLKENVEIEKEEITKIKEYLEQLYIDYCQYLFRQNKNTPNILSLSEVSFDYLEEGAALKKELIYKPSFEKNNRSDFPILSFIGTFNENYSGGEFSLNDKKILLTTGSILVFPSNFIFKYKMDKVKTGGVCLFNCFGY
jgi:hypothetical protein